MNIEIPLDQINFIQNSIHSGTYQSESEVVVAALDLLRRKEESLKSLREELDPALEELEQGGGVIIEPSEIGAFFDDIVRRGNERNQRKSSS